MNSCSIAERIHEFRKHLHPNEAAQLAYIADEVAALEARLGTQTQQIEEAMFLIGQSLSGNWQQKQAREWYDRNNERRHAEQEEENE